MCKGGCARGCLSNGMPFFCAILCAIHGNIGNAGVVSESLWRICERRTVKNCSHVLHDPLLLGMLILVEANAFGKVQLFIMFCEVLRRLRNDIAFGQMAFGIVGGEARHRSN